MSSEKVWWYSRGNERQGPYTAVELKALVASGQVAAVDMVWKEGLANWVQATSVSGLFASSGGGVLPPLLSNQERSVPAGAAPRQKMHWVVTAMLSIVGMFVSLIILVAIFGRSDNNSLASSPGGPVSAGVKKSGASAENSGPLKVGDTFETSTFQLSVASAQLVPSVGNSMFRSNASTGGVYVAIRWRYKNISKKPVSAFDLPTLHVVAPDGTKYDPDIRASASYSATLNTNAKVFSDLNPGIQVDDADVFEVSREHFDSASWNIFIDADQPIRVEFLTP